MYASTSCMDKYATLAEIILKIRPHHFYKIKIQVKLLNQGYFSFLFSLTVDFRYGVRGCYRVVSIASVSLWLLCAFFSFPFTEKVY